MIFCNTVIIENEQKTSNLLRFYLKEYCPEIEISAICKTLVDGKNKIVNHNPDIVFLDLDLDDGDGFTFLDELQQINFEVILTTRNKEQAIKAFDYNASHYLLKPFSPLELRKAVNRAVRNKLISNEMNEIVTESIKKIPKDRIQVRTSTGKTDIFVKDIIYIEYHRNQCNFILRSEKTIKSPFLLKYYEPSFTKYNFYKINHSYFVNLDYIKSYKESNNSELEMVNGDIIHIPIRKQKEIVHLMDKFIAGV
jgi:two-component system LytT family response regulator